MVSRVPTFSTNTKFIQLNMKAQANMSKYQYQTVTGYKGWTYDVYNRSVNRLITLENQVNMNMRFIETNNVTNTRMELSLNSIEKISSDVRDFRSVLSLFAGQDLSNWTPDYTVIPPKTLSPDHQSEIRNLQLTAFNLMKSLETYLNVSGDNGYIFSGGKTNTAPVTIPFKTLEEFQAYYDGNFVTYATTGAANLSHYSIADSVTGGVTLSSELIDVNDTTATGNINFSNDGYIIGSASKTGDITFSGNTITASVTSAFSIYETGDTFTISGTAGGQNDGLYTVKSISDNGKTITVERTLVNEVVTDGIGVVVDLQTTVDDRYIMSHITADNAGAFSDLKAGAVVTIKDSAGNDGTYYISSISSDGRSINILGTDRLSYEDITAGSPLSLSQDPNIGYIDAINGTGTSVTTITGGLGTTGTLTFDNATSTVTAANNMAFGYVKPGQTITITGTGAPPAGNDGTHYVKDVSADGRTLTLETPPNNQTVTDGTGAVIDLMSAQHGFIADNIICSENTSGTIYFDATKNEMVSTLKGAFSTIKAGDTIIINGTDNNNGAKQVKYVSDDGKTVVFEDETPIVAEAPITNGTGVNIGLTYPIGTTINLGNIDPRYNGQYTIIGVSDDGNRLIVSTDKFPPAGSPETFVATGKQVIDSESYYNGDHLVSEHRINETSTITSGTNAEDSAFEKVIRALGMICTGNLVDTRNPMDINETTYGVDSDRQVRIIDEALALLDDALKHDSKNVTEGKSDLTYLTYMFTVNVTTLETTIDAQTSLNVFLQNNIDDIEQVNKTEAAALFQEAYNNLEISMAALAQMLNLTLLNFLR